MGRRQEIGSVGSSYLAGTLVGGVGVEQHGLTLI